MSEELQNDSLVLSSELLSKYHAKEEDIASIAQAIEKKWTVQELLAYTFTLPPVSFLSWSLYYLPLSEEDKKAVKEALAISMSDAFYMSHNITNCRYISNSSYCENSTRIDNSKEIKYSSNVSKSYFIEDSEHINNSTEIFSSAHCYNSTNVIKSEYIYNSIDVQLSSSIVNSSNIVNSLFMINVAGADHCIRSMGAAIKNRIFCDEHCPDCDYALFNKPISERRFDTTFDRVAKILHLHPLRPGTTYAKNITPLWSVELPKIFERIWREIESIVGVDKLSREDKILLYRLTFVKELMF